jgi:MYXO-CTERM domain-containing protein
MKSCPAPDVCHLTGTCDSGTGACGSYPNAPDGTSCNDNNACTSNDRCQAGVCKGTPTSVACPATACNTGGTCNAATGKCDGTNRPDGTVCDDGDANTLNDHCVGGICKGTPRGVDPCYGQSDGTYCDDGDACTRSDFCLSGKCTGTNPKICAAAQQCQKPGQCDWQTGECVYPAKTNGTTCDDGNPNTTNDRCSNSKCIGDAVTVPDECQGKADGTACVGGTCKAGTCDTTVVPGNCGCGSTAGAGPASALLFAVGAMALVRRRRRN